MTPDHMDARDFVSEFLWIWPRHEGRLSVAARIFGMSPEALAQRLYRAKRTGIEVSFYNDINAAGDHMITMRVFGTPAPQGSKRHVGGGRMIEASKKVKPWRQAIVDQAIRDGVSGSQLDGPLMLRVTFYMQRPKFHSGAKGIKASAPPLPDRVPDLDKLLRSTCDALTDAQVIVDDARIVQIKARKIYADEVAPGAIIYLTHTNEGNENE